MANDERTNTMTDATKADDIRIADALMLAAGQHRTLDISQAHEMVARARELLAPKLPSMEGWRAPKEELQREYRKRVTTAYMQSLPAALCELAAILAELATQRQPVEERNVACRCCPDCNGPACVGPCRGRVCTCAEIPSLLDVQAPAPKGD